MTEFFALGQPVEFSHIILRRKDWNGKGTVCTWVPSLFQAQGFIVGWRTLSNGTIESYKESNGYGGWVHVSNEWRGSEYFKAYLVTYDLRCKPVYVLPEHLTA